MVTSFVDNNLNLIFIKFILQIRFFVLQISSDFCKAILKTKRCERAIILLSINILNHKLFPVEK